MLPLASDAQTVDSARSAELPATRHISALTLPVPADGQIVERSSSKSDSRSPIARLRRVVTRPFRSGFSHQVARTTVARLLQMTCGIVTSVIVTRSLGPAGRGVYATCGALSTIGTGLGNVGLPAANTFQVARESRHLPVLLGNSLMAAGVMGTAIGGAVWWLGRLRPELLPRGDLVLALTLIAIPLGLLQLLLQHLLVGLQEIRFFNWLTIAGGAVPLVAAAGLLAVDGISPASALAVGLIGAGIVAGTSGWRLLGLANGECRVSIALLRHSLSYGLRAWATTLAYTLILRIDLLMLGQALGNEAVGQYSTAASMAEWAMLVPSVCGLLLFPQIAAQADRGEQWRLCFRTIPAFFTLMLTTCVISAAMARPAIDILYGETFRPAAAVYLWLAPGVFFRGAAYPAALFLGGIGRPLSHLVLCLGLVVMNAVLNALLIPRAGMQGAAAVSSFTYLAGFAGSFWLARRYATRDPSDTGTSRQPG